MNSPDIIKDASDALQQISDRGITVMQGWYDKDIHDRHAVSYTHLTGLKVRERFDVQAVDKDAVIKGEITEVVNG